jgi:hypothetical protein
VRVSQIIGRSLKNSRELSILHTHKNRVTLVREFDDLRSCAGLCGKGATHYKANPPEHASQVAA